jgi:hypothetical protein
MLIGAKKIETKADTEILNDLEMKAPTIEGQLLLLFLQQYYGWTLCCCIDVEKLSNIGSCSLIKVDAIFQP